MAKNKNSLNFPVKTFSVVSVLALALTIGLFAMKQNTEYRQQASQEEDLNSVLEITQTRNPDNSMGPQTWAENFSNTIAATDLGTLAIKVTDPLTPQTKGKSENARAEEHAKAGKENRGKKPLEAATEKGNQGRNGQTPSLQSLHVTVSKIEVHLANLCKPNKFNNPPQGDELVPSKERGNPNKIDGADKWETLKLGEGNSSFDLIELAKNNVAVDLGLTQLACGKYTEIRLYVSSATATFEGEEKEVPLTILGKQGIVRIVRPFTIEPNQTTTLSIDFNAQKSIQKIGDTYILKPVVAKFTTDK